jgi:hypothetical protein
MFFDRPCPARRRKPSPSGEAPKGIPYGQGTACGGRGLSSLVPPAGENRPLQGKGDRLRWKRPFVPRPAAAKGSLEKELSALRPTEDGLGQ